MTFFDQLGFPDTILLFDGPMGTELHRRGVPTPLPGWSAHALLTHPEIVRTIHDEYIRAGADVITTNTFRTNARAGRNAGLDGRAPELTATAVRIAREAAAAAGRRVLVAGSVAPVEDSYKPELVPYGAGSEDESVRSVGSDRSDRSTISLLSREHEQLISWLADAGVDLIKIETMNTQREAVAAVEAAKRVTRLPVIASVVCAPAARLLSGEDVCDAAHAMIAAGADAFMINCSSIADTTAAIEALGGITQVPIGVAANGGAPDPATWWEGAHMATPEEYLSAARGWIERGARIIGSCCGTQPAHIAKLRSSLWDARSQECQESR